MYPTEPTRLEQTVALLEATLEATRDAILVLDLDRRVICYNRQFLRMFGFTPEDMTPDFIARTTASLSSQLENSDVLLGRSERLWSDPATEVVDTLRFKDGRVYERFVAPHRMGGQIVGIVASYHDISQTVRTEQSLDQHRDFLERAQQVAQLGSWVVELDGSERLTCSDETRRILSLPPGPAMLRFSTMLEFVHPDDRDAVRRASEEAIRSRRAYDIEHRIVRQDHAIRWMHTRADVVSDPAGRPLRLVGTLQDITDRRELEERLRQAQKLEAIGRLAGGIAHDLNNVLTAIAGYTELALETIEEEHPARADVMEIRKAAERAEAVTRQLLAFSRKQMLEPRVFPISQSIADLGRMLERLLGEGIDLTLDVAPEVPPIYGDPGQIEQAIVNLVVNARDAMPEGGRLAIGVSLRELDEAFVRTHKPMPPGRYVVVSVADTGVGMDAETQAHVFEPFFTTKDVGKGTGLGLATVYGTVKQSGGFVFLESEPGRGTTFRLYFPPAPDDKTAPGPPPRPTGFPTVLVVERETSLRRLVVASLKSAQYDVVQASSGHEALRLASGRGPVDAMVTAAGLTDMSGYELARAVRDARPASKILVIAEEGSPAGELPPSGALLRKPHTPKDVRRKIDEMLGRSRASGR